MYQHLDRRRDFHVQGPAQRPDRSHLGGANAVGERTQRAVTGGVAVRADHHRPGQDVAVLRQDLVADAALVAADIVELADALLGHELAHLLLVGGGLGALGRDAVIEDDRDPLRVPDLGVQAGALIDLLELVEDQGRILVRHRQVDARLEHIARFYGGLARSPGPGSFRPLSLA